MFWWSDIISGGLGPPSVVNAVTHIKVNSDDFKFYGVAIFQGIYFPLKSHILFYGKLNESGFRPLLCTYRLNWARRTT